MALSARKVESLVEDEPELADALSAILERAETGDGEVEWTDVKEDITSGQWGRLIEQGVLVDGERGFVIANPEAVKTALDERGYDVDAAEDATDEVEEAGADDGEDDEGGWSQWDKMAGLASVGLLAGYYVGGVRNVIGGAVDVVLGPLDQVLPFYAVILIIAVVTGVYSAILQSNLLDTDKIEQVQERMNDIQERRKAAKERGDDEALERIQEEQMEAMGDQLGMFKLQFRPMVWVMLLTIPAFLWMYWKILPAGSGTVLDPDTLQVVMPLIGRLESWRAGVVGPVQAWLLWYFLCSVAFSNIVRKTLDIQATPT